MANTKDFKVKNGIKPTVYHEGVGTVTSGSVGYSLSSASYDSKSFSVASQATTPVDLQIETNGTKLYVFNRNGVSSAIYQYSLSTSFDISTASYDSVSLTLDKSAQSYGCYIDSTGTYIYHIASTGAIYQYSMSTSWDLSTASYDSKTITLSSQDTATVGLYLGDSGTKLYLMGQTNTTVYQYTLSTAYDISTASYASKSLNVSSQSGSAQAVWFSEDGKNLFYMGYSNTSIYQYSLSTAWDISTATYSGISFNVSSNGSFHFGLCFTATGNKLYVPSNGDDTIYQYSTALYTRTLDLSTGSVFEITPTSDIQIGLSNPAASGTVSAATLLLDGVGVNGFILDGASYDSISFSVSSEELAPTGLFFKSDGTKMYVIGTVGDDVNEYDLSVAWDITTASYLQNFSVASQETVPTGISFSSDGTKMYVIGTSSDAVNEYSLSTAWDISTASYTQNFSVSSQETAPEDVTFKPDGTKMYVVNLDVHEYDLSTAWDVSTASHTRTAVLPSATSIFFKPDGTKMFLSTSVVREYDLSTAWDISTASLSVTLSGLEETVATGLFFKVNGTKMYITGGTGDAVYQYSTATPATITYDSTIKFAGGTAPTSPAIGDTDVLTFSTRNGGTSYQSVLAIDGAK